MESSFITLAIASDINLSATPFKQASFKRKRRTNSISEMQSEPTSKAAGNDIGSSRFGNRPSMLVMVFISVSTSTSDARNCCSVGFKALAPKIALFPAAKSESRFSTHVIPHLDAEQILSSSRRILGRPALVVPPVSPSHISKESSRHPRTRGLGSDRRIHVSFTMLCSGRPSSSPREVQHGTKPPLEEEECWPINRLYLRSMD
mmetsp:Transcript_67361/g.106617  ORF Transcript_67361/g.106617 Transcript_67361/m.106617 type:complete len:204 (-) Transcript_67361:19-630(-)